MAAVVLMATSMPAFVCAAEIRLRSQCRPEGPLVTLGHVAEVCSVDPQEVEELSAVELFPVPTGTQTRYLRRREIQDLLLLRGVALTHHRFSGASQVSILGKDHLRRADAQRPLSGFLLVRAKRRVSQAVVEHLCNHVAVERPWTVDFKLSESQARLVVDPRCEISINGGAPPWTGSQHFQATVNTQDGRVQFPLRVQVALPPAVVVTARSLRRGATITREAVELQYVALQDDSADGFHCLADVVGKETARAVPEGKLLQPKMLREPLLVRRREIVTVYVRSRGIRVRTTGRACEDGSLGDLIPIESMKNRKTYFAKVCGTREVEVCLSTPASSAAPRAAIERRSS